MKESKRDHFAAVIVGYLVAAVAVAFSKFFLLTSPRIAATDIFALSLYLSLFIAVVGLPVFLPWLVFAETKEIRKPIPFAMAGAVAGAFGQFAINVLLAPPNAYAAEIQNGTYFVVPGFWLETWDNLTTCFSGVLGGLTYWAIAGRHSGSWKSNP
jgi:hypothetical protein